MKKIQSTCNVCSLACNLDFYVQDNLIVKVIPTKDYPVNQGFACIKGISLDKQTTKFKPSPLPKRRDPSGNYIQMKWEEGYDYVAHELLRIQETYGSYSLAAIRTGQIPLEEMALFSHIMRNFLKSNVDGNTHLCMATSVVAYKQSFGFDAPPYTLNDLELSDTIFLIGANPIVAHPIIWNRICHNPHKKIIVIDPRKSETAKADIYLFYGLAHILIEKGAIDHAYIDAHTQNFEAFKDHVAQYHPETVAEHTALSLHALYEMATLITEGKRVSFWWTMGVVSMIIQRVVLLYVKHFG